MKSKVKYISVIIVISIVMFMTLLYQASIAESFYKVGVKTKEIKEECHRMEYILDGMVIEERFIAKENNLEKVKIGMDILEERITNENYPFYKTSAVIGIKEIGTDKILKEVELTNFTLTKIENNILVIPEDYALEFAKQKDSKGKEYSVYLKYTVKDEQEHIFSPIYYKGNTMTYGDMYINGNRIEGDLKIEDYYLDQVSYIEYICLIFMMFSIGIAVLWIIISRKETITAERTFLFTIPLICTFMIIAIMMGYGNDESTHFYRCYDIMRGNFIANISEEGKVKIEVPKQIKAISYDKIEKENTETVDILTDAVYSPIQFMPQVIGMKIASIFSNNAFILALAGRIINVICSLILLYLAIKMIPFGKKILLLLTVIPIAIEGMVTLSPDGLTMCISFFFIAYIMKLAFDTTKKVKFKDGVLLTILCILLSQYKITYLPLIGLLLIIPTTQFKNKKQKILQIGISWTLAVAASLIWLSIGNQYAAILNGGISQVNKLLLFQEPIKAFQMMLYTISLQADRYLISSFGGRVGWASIVQVNLIPIILYTVTIINAVGDSKLKKRFTNFQKIIMVLVILAIIGLILLSEFLTWTVPGTTFINGLQGRYFIPFMPLILFLVGSIPCKLEYSEEKQLKIIATLGIIISLYIAGMFMIVS